MIRAPLILIGSVLAMVAVAFGWVDTDEFGAHGAGFFIPKLGGVAVYAIPPME